MKINRYYLIHIIKIYKNILLLVITVIICCVYIKYLESSNFNSNYYQQNIQLRHNNHIFCLNKCLSLLQKKKKNKLN